MSRLKKALEKAKEARMDEGIHVLRDKEDVLAPSGQDSGEQQFECDGINPEYCDTKRISIDTETLRRRKIVSLFHDGAITAQLKILRTQVLNKMEEIGGNSLLITSANPSEGKTTTAINLAVSISQKLDHTVLLVDADLGKPFVHDFFGLDVQRGLSDYLLRQAEIPDLLINPGIEKLVILPGGQPLSNSSEHLGAPRMESLVKEMKERYPNRFIIFDSSSLLATADPLVFSRFTDGVLLIVESERTSAKDLEAALKLLKDRTIIGTIFNKAIG